MEGDAGTSRLNPTDAHDSHMEPLSEAPDETTTAEPEVPHDVADEAADNRRPERLGIGAVVGLCLAVLLLAAGKNLRECFALLFKLISALRRPPLLATIE